MFDLKISISHSRVRAAAEDPYKVISVEEVGAPDRGADGVWHRYVIESKRSVITGCRNGSKVEVTEYAAHFVEQLNARRKCLDPTPSWARWVSHPKKG